MICSKCCWLGLFTIGIIIITWVTGYRIQLLKGTEISTNWLVNLGELGRTPSWLGDKDHHQITIFSYHLVVLFRQPLKELESEVCILMICKRYNKRHKDPTRSERLIQIEGGRTMWNHHFSGQRKWNESREDEVNNWIETASGEWWFWVYRISLIYRYDKLFLCLELVGSK